jgi:isopentenyl-diphosphate Delta-isomerase
MSPGRKRKTGAHPTSTTSPPLESSPRIWKICYLNCVPILTHNPNAFIDMPLITFVDEDDNVIGAGTKDESWQAGAWHRIVRVFLLNGKGEVLMTRRAASLVASPNKWNESCSGHVDEGESYEEAALRELHEEVGVSGVTLTPLTKVKHTDTDDPRRLKKRFHMIFTGRYDGPIHHDPDEVAETRWVNTRDLDAWIRNAPSDFTEGFRVAYGEFAARGTMPVTK